MLKVFLLWMFIFFPLTGCYSQQETVLKQQVDKGNNKKVLEDTKFWDFGEIKEGLILNHTFIFKNESKGTLTIKGVDTSCGCAISKVTKKILLTGESTSIEVSFDTKGYSGPVQQYIYLNTDDLDNPIIRYIIKADLIK
jgi:hypothetical protein